MAIYRGEGGAGDATADASNAAAIADGFADAANASAGQAAASAASALAAKVAAELAETNAETAETNAEAAEAAAVVAKDAAEAVLLDTGFSVVASDLQGADTIGTVAADIVNVNSVATNMASILSVDANEANINIVAADGTDIGTVATNIANVNATGSNIANVNAVGADLLEPVSEINTVAVDIANVNTVGTNIANVNTVAGISANVTSVASNSTNINTVATNIANVNSVGGNIANVNSVAGNATNINAVAGNNTNITTVAGISGNVTTVATNNANVTTVAGSIANVNTNATNIANINQNAANIVAIQGASANATAAATSATAAAGSATSASASAAAASAVALGNEPVRHSVRPSLLLDFANTKTLDPRITFTRASTGTYYDGKTVAKAEENLVQYSQEFDNAYWEKSSVTVTANNTTAPDGTTTAELVYPTTTGASRIIGRNSVTGVASTVYTLSVFAKANGINFLYFTTLGGSSTASACPFFDLQNGTVGQTGTFFSSTSITSVGNGWYRCTATGTAASASIFPYFGVADANNDRNATTSGTNGVFLWGAQLEQRSSVTAYTATTTAPITNYIPALQTAAAGVARFEHNPVTGESLGLEIEEQRTNLVLRSDDFANASWVKSNCTILSNTIIAPDGSLVGDTLIPTSASGGVYQGVTIANATAHTWSVYAKAAGFNWIRFLAQDTVTLPCVWFNLATGQVGTVQSGVTATITSVGNGWYRCTATKTSASTSAFMNIIPVNADGSDTSTTNGFSGIYIWGAQLEAGSFATSYIPTVASQVTRSADSASMTGTNFSSWYKTDEGTLYADGIRASGTSTTYPRFAGLYRNGLEESSISIGQWTPTSRVEANVYGNGAIQAAPFVTVSGAVYGTPIKGALAYRVNDFAFSANGVAAGTDTSGIVPIVNSLYIGSNGTIFPLNGTIAKVAYYPKRLTNQELVGLTTV